MLKLRIILHETQTNLISNKQRINIFKVKVTTSYVDAPEKKNENDTGIRFTLFYF